MNKCSKDISSWNEAWQNSKEMGKFLLQPKSLAMLAVSTSVIVQLHIIMNDICKNPEISESTNIIHKKIEKNIPNNRRLHSLINQKNGDQISDINLTLSLPKKSNQTRSYGLSIR